MNQQLFDMVMQNAQATMVQDLFAAKVCLGIAIGLAGLVLAFVALAVFEEAYSDERCGYVIASVVTGVIAVLLFCAYCSNYNEALRIKTNPSAWAQHKVADAVAAAVN